jgi:L,D-peptidoglycan transpeptidase YkuD (ErfK/YbiS/YcfS/YnhG family)
MSFQRLGFILLLAVSLLTPSGLRAFSLPASSTQCVVGTADGWNSSHVNLALFEKRDGTWRQSGPSWTGRLGKSGLAWGRGIHPNPPGATLKREGDLRAPAGVFHLGGAWGYAAQIRKHPKLFYHQVTSRDLWVEDPGSEHYNRFLTLPHEPKTAWEKEQQMHQNDPPHALKLFIAHNAPPNVVPGGGSSIFFHIWRGEGARPSAGCTTMAADKLSALIARIDPTRRPLYVLLPKAEYEKRRQDWKLP